MKRLLALLGVVLITAVLGSIAWTTFRTSRAGDAWDSRYAAARAEADCEAVEALLLGGVAASYPGAMHAWADAAEPGECDLPRPIVELAESAHLLAGDLEPIWITDPLLFEGLLRAFQLGAIFTGDDPNRVALIERLYRDCSSLWLTPAVMFDRDLLRSVAAASTPTVEEVVQLIRADTEQCRLNDLALIERTRMSEVGDWTPAACDGLRWHELAFIDPDALYRLASECEPDETNGLRGEIPTAPGDYYREEHATLREAASHGHVLAARDYGILTRELIENSEAADGPLPTHRDPSWIAYLYSRRAFDEGEATADLVDFYAARLSGDCRRLADAFYEQLSAAWSGQDADWGAAAVAVSDARSCGPYIEYDDWTFEALSRIADIPEFAPYSDRVHIRLGLFPFEQALLEELDGAGLTSPQ